VAERVCSVVEESEFRGETGEYEGAGVMGSTTPVRPHVSPHRGHLVSRRPHAAPVCPRHYPHHLQQSSLHPAYQSSHTPHKH